MKRGPTGTFQVAAAGGDSVRAFLPVSLPPVPPLDYDGNLQQQLENAVIALGRLDGVSAHLPDPSLFLYAYVRKEAVLSSQIEGTQSSLSDLLLFELNEAPGVPVDDVVEVSNYVAAVDHGLARLRAGQRQGAWRVSPVAELDRRNQAGERRLRSAAPHGRA